MILCNIWLLGYLWNFSHPILVGFWESEVHDHVYGVAPLCVSISLFLNCACAVYCSFQHIFVPLYRLLAWINNLCAWVKTRAKLKEPFSTFTKLLWKMYFLLILLSPTTPWNESCLITLLPGLKPLMLLLSCMLCNCAAIKIGNMVSKHFPLV